MGERVIGWADADGGRGWQRPGGAPDRLGRRQGLTLRPTGMVVFATLENGRSRSDGARARRRPAAWGPEPLSPIDSAGRSHGVPTTPTAGPTVAPPGVAGRGVAPGALRRGRCRPA